MKTTLLKIKELNMKKEYLSKEFIKKSSEDELWEMLPEDTFLRGGGKGNSYTASRVGGSPTVTAETRKEALKKKTK